MPLMCLYIFICCDTRIRLTFFYFLSTVQFYNILTPAAATVKKQRSSSTGSAGRTMHVNNLSSSSLSSGVTADDPTVKMRLNSNGSITQVRQCAPKITSFFSASKMGGGDSSTDSSYTVRRPGESRVVLNQGNMRTRPPPGSNALLSARHMQRTSSMSTSTSGGGSSQYFKKVKRAPTNISVDVSTNNVKV